MFPCLPQVGDVPREQMLPLPICLFVRQAGSRSTKSLPVPVCIVVELAPTSSGLLKSRLSPLSDLQIGGGKETSAGSRHDLQRSIPLHATV